MRHILLTETKTKTIASIVFVLYVLGMIYHVHLYIWALIEETSLHKVAKYYGLADLVQKGNCHTAENSEKELGGQPRKF